MNPDSLMKMAFLAAQDSNSEVKAGAVLSRGGMAFLIANRSLPEHVAGVYEWESSVYFEASEPVSREDLVKGGCPALEQKYSRDNGYSGVIVSNLKENVEKRTYEYEVRGKKAPLMFENLIKSEVQDLISTAANKGIAVSGSTLYITHEPSLADSILLAGSGIKEVVCAESFKNRTTVMYLKESGVEVREQNKTKTDQL